jgi:dTDP-4-dehydrorhamnose reductase
MRILLIGANGQLGQDLLAELRRTAERETAALTHAQIEITDLASVRRALALHQPQAVINTAAFHKVDVCEDEAEKAFAVNTLGARNLALACRERDLVLVSLSTDYVFSGKKAASYVEDDPVDPINLYGISKAAGEMAIRYVWDKHFIVRTGELYGTSGASGKGDNFVELMLRLALEGKAIRVVDDQVVTPTSTHALAQQIVALLDTQGFGTYHATCQGECSWYDFAREIFRRSAMVPALSRQSTAQSGARARRPAYSVLDNARLRGLGLDLMLHWEQALRTYLKARASQ